MHLYRINDRAARSSYDFNFTDHTWVDTRIHLHSWCSAAPCQILNASLVLHHREMNKDDSLPLYTCYS